MNINKNLFLVTSVFIILLIFYSAAVLAQSENEDPPLKQRMSLIEASQQLRQEQTEEPAAGVSLFMTNYHSGDKELNLGAKYENRLLEYTDQSIIELNYVIEGIYLEGEDENLAGFLSLKASLKNRMYIGAGPEIMDVADYQAFVGLNLTDNFFVETKFIDDKKNSDSDDFYSALGFKINF